MTYETFIEKVNITDFVTPISTGKKVAFCLARFILYPKTTEPFFYNAWWPLSKPEDSEKARRKLYLLYKSIKLNIRTGLSRKRGRFIITKIEQVEP